MARFAVGYVLAVITIEFAIGFAFLLTTNEENCGNGVPRWSCNESLQDFLGIAFFVFPAICVLAPLIGVATTRKQP